MEASKPKWVNFDYIWYEVNSLRLGGLYIRLDNYTFYPYARQILTKYSWC